VLPTPRPWERVIELPVSLLPRLVLQVIGTLRTEGGAAWPADLQHAKVIALVVGDRDETPAAGRTVASLPVVLEGSREVAFSMELPDLLRPPHDRVFEGVGDPYLALAFALIDDLDDDGRLDMHGDRCLLVGWDVWDFYVRGPVPMLLPHGFPTGHSLVEPPEEGGGGEEGEEEEGGFSLERLPDDTPVTLTWTGLPRCGPPEEPPPEVRSCEDLSDDDVMKAVYEGPKVPEGFYSDPPDLEGSLRWQDPCSDSLDATRAAAGQTFANGQLTGDERTTDWFHEVDVRINAGANLVHFRQDRCDWWDGQRLGGGPHLDFGGLGFLAGYRWYVHNHNIGGHAILRGFGQIGNASHFYDLCYVRTVFGDWGLADAITVLWTRYRIGIEDGDVEVLREAEVVRELEGRRN